MKILLLIVIYFLPIIAFCQSEVSSDNVDYELVRYHEKYPSQLGKPNFDRVSIEVRIWISGIYYSDTFIKISRDQQGVWSYARGYLDHKNNKAVVLQNHSSTLNLDSIWQIFLSNKILTLPDQQNASIKILHKDLEIPIDQGQKQKLIDMVAKELYIIEVYDSDRYTQYGYYSPKAVSKMCENNNMKCEEHKLMNNIIDVVYQNFQMKDILTTQLEERRKKKKR